MSWGSIPVGGHVENPGRQGQKQKQSGRFGVLSSSHRQNVERKGSCVCNVMESVTERTQG